MKKILVKKFLRVALLTVVLAVLVLGGLSVSGHGLDTLQAHAASQGAAPAAPTRTVTSAGNGEVSVKPDQTTLSLGVQMQDKDAKAAQSAANTAMNAVVTALKKAGVKEADIKTSQYSIYPNYDWSNEKQTLTGYTATSMVTVRVDGTDVGGLIDAATAAGANQMNGVTFGLKDESAPYQQALQKAIADAKTKAGILAKAAGCAVDAVVTIVEDGASISPISEYGVYDVAAMSASRAAGTQLMTGEMTVAAGVSVTYTLK